MANPPAKPVNIVASGGIPVVQVASTNALAGVTMTPTSGAGIAITLVAANGIPAALINENGDDYVG